MYSTEQSQPDLQTITLQVWINYGAFGDFQKINKQKKKSLAHA